MATKKLSARAAARLKAERAEQRAAERQRAARAARRAELAAQREAERQREIRAERRRALAEEKRQLEKFDFKTALKGDRRAGVPGLRSIIDGLGAGEGFNLRDIDQWTLKQKRRVRDSFNAVRALEAQPKRIVRPRSKESIRKFQAVLHPDVKIPGLKVAFYPFVEPRKLPGAKPVSSRVRLTKSGVKITGGANTRIEQFFDLERLAVDPAAEVKRAVDALGPRVGMLKIQVGEYETLGDITARGMTEKIKGWMMKYNGVTPFTAQDGRKFWDRPEQHHYSRWLKGVVGYTLKKGESRLDLVRKISNGIRDYQAKAREVNRAVKGKRKGRGR